jgi:type VI secretion system ImpB/VipA family protein
MTPQPFRPLRARISYDVDTGGAFEKRELPFVVGLLADLSGNAAATGRPPVNERSMVDIEAATFDAVLASFDTTITFDYTSPRDGSIHSGTLSFGTLDDFTPPALVRRFEPLKALHSERACTSEVTQGSSCGAYDPFLCSAI